MFCHRLRLHHVLTIMITIKLGVIDLRVIDDDYLKKLFKIVNDYDYDYPVSGVESLKG